MASAHASVEAAVAHYEAALLAKDAEHDEYIKQSEDVEKELEEQLQIANAQIKSLQAQLQHVTTQWQQNKAETQALIVQCSDLQQAKSDAATKQEDAKMTIRDLESRVDQLESNERAMQATLDAAEDRLNRQLEENAVLRTTVEETVDTQATLQRLKDELQEYKDDKAARLQQDSLRHRGAASEAAAMLAGEASSSTVQTQPKSKAIYEDIQAQMLALNARLDACRLLVTTKEGQAEDETAMQS